MGLAPHSFILDHLAWSSIKWDYCLSPDPSKSRQSLILFYLAITDTLKRPKLLEC